MRESVYVETSVVSYLTARAANDPQVAVLQSMTVAWWNRRDQFDAIRLPSYCARRSVATRNWLPAVSPF
jgi:hypothetical protein